MSAETWENKLIARLPALGHRNWIVIADAAYPWQTAPGIETVVTGENQLQVLAQVLGHIARADHVRPIVYLDAELPLLTEQRAPGIDTLRRQMEELLHGQDVNSRPHEDIIAKLDEAGKTFRILLLKTDLTLPYTSVFIQLDCGYWSDSAEQELRRSFAAGQE